jgi:predicted metalloprotease with PDZ domain
VVSAKDPLVREKLYLDADLQRLAYQRGGLLAATWDSGIRQQSQGKQSLDDAMLALRQGASRREQVLTESFLGDHS